MADNGLATVAALIVDSDATAAKSLQSQLLEAGLGSAVVTSSVADALHRIDTTQKRFELIFTELDLPGIDGMEFMRLLAERRIDCCIFVVSAQPEGIINSVGEMIQHYGFAFGGALAKPVSRELIRNRLAAYQKMLDAAERSSGARLTLDKGQVRYCLGESLFEAFFQPKIFVANQQPCGVEALARCQHPQFGLLSPDAFIESAEAAGLIDEVTFALLDSVAVELEKWSSRGLELHVAMNISRRSLASPQFCSRFFELLQQRGIPANKILIEISEHVAHLDGVARYLESLNRLRMHGIGLSIDDFGSGSSSLSNLTSIPFTELKLARSLVTGIAEQPRLQSLVKGSISMARDLGAVTVAQGVETPADWEFLQSLGCDIAQGFLIAAPLPANEFEQWCNTWQGVSTTSSRQKPETGASVIAKPVAAAKAATEFSHVRVIVVDDDSLVVKLLCKTLNHFGITDIVTGYNATDALNLLDDPEVGLLIVDIVMPDINGLDLLKMVRTGQTKAPKNLPVVMMTSLSSADNVGIAISLDANGFLVKPFKPKAVLNTLLKTLGEKRLQPQDKRVYDSVSTTEPTAKTRAAGSQRVEQLKQTQDAASKNIERPAGAPPKTPDKPAPGVAVHLDDLQAGMRLLEGVYSISGALILPKDTILHHRHINRLHQLADVLEREEFAIDPETIPKTSVSD